MSTETDLERYLHVRARQIHLPPGDLGAVTRRARHLRRRRTAARGGIAAALLAGGSLLVVDRARSTDVTEQAGPGGGTAVASPLDWTVVASGAGLGSSAPTVEVDGAVYSLSTAPGPEPDGPPEPRQVYRSTDGTDWEGVALPEGLHPSSIAAETGSLYAVGTTAAGGEVTGVTIATSTDGGDGWAEADLPLDLDALGEGFPGTVVVSDTSVAATRGTTVVAVTLRGTVDPDRVFGPGASSEGWFQEPSGVTLIPECSADDGAEEGPVTTAPPASAGRSTAEDGADGPGANCEQQHRSWAEIGLDDAQVQLARGEVRVFTATDGAPLRPTLTVEATSLSGVEASDLITADDGWWLAGTALADDPAADVAAPLELWHSNDGTTWSEAGPSLPGAWLAASGVVDGRPVLVTVGGPEEPSVVVHRVEVGGAVTSVDLAELLDLPRGSFHLARVGPLGVAVVLPADEGDHPDLVVAHSLDGVTFARTTVPRAEDGTHQSLAGVTVTADAIKVRLNVRTDATPPDGPPAEQRLFVGTPR